MDDDALDEDLKLDLDREEARGARMWQMASGKYISVSDMGDDHLRNCHRHMWRRAEMFFENHLAASSAMFQGEMASYYADQAADEFHEEEMHCRAWMDIFLEEMKERGLEPYLTCA